MKISDPTITGTRVVGLSNYYSTIERNFPMKVSKIIYASPGFKDITGLGEAISHIKDIIIKIMDYFMNSDQRKQVIRGMRIENDKQQLDLEILKIKKNQEYINLLRDCGFTKAEIRKILILETKGVEQLGELVKSGKITGVE